MFVRVLHVYRTYFPDPPGGLQEAIRQIALATTAHGVEARIFTLSPSPYPRISHHPEAVVVRERSWLAPFSCDMGGLSAFHGFTELCTWADVLHFHFPWPFADVLHLVTRPMKPAIMTYHSDIVRQRLMGLIYGPVMRRMLTSMSAIVATSPAYALTSQVLGAPTIRDRVRVIPLGIDDRAYPRPDLRILGRLGVDDRPFFLFIGVLRYYKGLRTLVQAASGLDARVVIAGSGPEEGPLKEHVERLQLSNVIFAGQVADEEKTALLTHCRALILPSHLRSEAFGMVLVEAAMFGKPMISCEIGTGTTFVNIDGETGLVVPPENSTDLAQAMTHLLENDEACACFGVAARKRYEHLFSSEALGQAYANLYREVAARK